MRRADRLRMLTTLWRTTSSTRTRLISSSSWALSSSSFGCSWPASDVSSSATYGPFRCIGSPCLLDGAAVDLLDRRPFGEPIVRALGPVPLGQLDLHAQGRPCRLGPLDDPLEHVPGGDHTPLSKVDHLPVHPVPDRPPEVLLDLALSKRVGCVALVEVDRRLRHACGNQGGQVERLVPPGLGVADPDLDGAEGVMRANAPPQLRRLDDRVRLRQEADEVLVGGPIPERLVNAAARECTREDLGAHGMEPSVAMIQEGRIG